MNSPITEKHLVQGGDSFCAPGPAGTAMVVTTIIRYVPGIRSQLVVENGRTPQPGSQQNKDTIQWQGYTGHKVEHPFLH